MMSRWEAWLRMLPVWLPAVLLSIASVSAFLWQSSDSTGAEGRLRAQEQELEASILNLQKIGDQATAQREAVAALNEHVQRLSQTGFGSLEERLTDIMRAVGSATRNSGLLPSTYSYSAQDDKQVEFTRFSVHFSVRGRYDQVRQMLAELQQSPEILIVDSLSLTGEEVIASKELSITIRLSTYLSQVDQRMLEDLNRGLIKVGGEDG
jgi:Tfp pilus assembly protein PilO